MGSLKSASQEAGVRPGCDVTVGCAGEDLGGCCGAEVFVGLQAVDMAMTSTPDTTDRIQQEVFSIMILPFDRGLELPNSVLSRPSMSNIFWVVVTGSPELIQALGSELIIVYSKSKINTIPCAFR